MSRSKMNSGSSPKGKATKSRSMKTTDVIEESISVDNDVPSDTPSTVPTVQSVPRSTPVPGSNGWYKN